MFLLLLLVEVEVLLLLLLVGLLRLLQQQHTSYRQ